jgi:hypothetical protein
MTKRLGLSAMQRSTQYAPLAALGAFLQQRDFFAPLWEHVQLSGKTIHHEPHQKLLDVVVSMLADGFVANSAQEVMKGQVPLSAEGIKQPGSRTVRPQCGPRLPPRPPASVFS